jgi:hypothetical protein
VDAVGRIGIEEAGGRERPWQIFMLLSHRIAVSVACTDAKYDLSDMICRGRARLEGLCEAEHAASEAALQHARYAVGLARLPGFS